MSADAQSTLTSTDWAARVATHPFTMTIDGRGVDGTSDFGVANPATGEPLTRAPKCSLAQLEQAVSSAQRAFGTWRDDIGVRRAALRAIADRIVENAELIGATVTLEQGKPFAEGVADVVRSSDWFRYFAELDPGDRVIQDDADGFVEVVHRPLGVVAGIIPRNQPMLTISWKLAPALVAGNTVVLKPSSETPLTALLVAELVRDLLPPGVFNCVSGPEPLGSQLIAHPLVRKVSFTGSTAVGKSILSSTADDLKRVTLELGGNDAAIVLDDADPDAFAQQLFWAAFKNNGQMCALIKRLFVPESRRRSYVEAIGEFARGVRVGDGMQDGTQLGPIATHNQLRTVREIAAATESAGATIVTGGRTYEGSGYFFDPMVVSDVDDRARIVADEQFGPIMPIIGYRNIDEAVARANDTRFGLGGSVWGVDTEHARKVAMRLDSGQASVNHHTRGILPHLPFGGAKRSGIGTENGPWGLEAFTQLQTVAGPARITDTNTKER